MPSAKPILPSFASGEVSPQLFGRVDLQKYQTGLEKAENLIVLPTGGATSRPGTRFVAKARESGKKVRLIPFRFSTTQAYILEFGHEYIRVYKDGAQVTYDALTITGASNGNPVRITTSTNHGYTTGDRVVISGVDGMKELNNRQFKITVHDANEFDLSEEDGTPVNGTAYDAYVSDPYPLIEPNPTVAKIVEVRSGKSITNVSKAATAVVTSMAHGLTNGQRIFISGVVGMTELNGLEYTVSDVAANTFKLSGINSTSFTTYKSGGMVQWLGTPFIEDALRSITSAQSADVIYLANTAYKPRKLSRSSHTEWTLSEVNFIGGPLQMSNLDPHATEVSADAVSGPDVTLNATDGGFFTAADVGALFMLEVEDGSQIPPWEPSVINISVGDYVQYAGRIYECMAKANNSNVNGTVPPTHEIGEAWDGWNKPVNGQGGGRLWRYASAMFGVVSIFSVDEVDGDSAHASVPVNSAGQSIDLPYFVTGVSFTWRYARGEWSDTRGWPGAVAFHEQRLFWAGSPSAPQTIWGSKTGDYENHTAGDRDDDALVYTLATNEMNFIKWLRPMKALVFGTASGEFVASGADSGSPLTPNNIHIVPGTSEGSGLCQPVRVGTNILFTNAGQRRLMELVYSYEQDAFVAPDRMILAEHLTSTTSQLKELAWQQEPNRTLWACTTDGKLLSLTYRPDHDVFAWSRHPMSGKVESIAVIPTQDGTSSEVWLVVAHTFIDGEGEEAVERTERYIEVMTQPHEPADEDDKAGCVFLDSSLEFTSDTPADEMSGLWHLNGKSVAILADGAVHPNRTVENGRIVLDRNVSRAQIGLPYTQKLQTLRLEVAALGSVQGKKRRIPDVKIQFRNTLGGKVGVSEDALQTIPTLGTGHLGQSPPLFNGIRRIACESRFEEDGGQIVIVQDQPLPMTVLSIMPTISVTEA